MTPLQQIDRALRGELPGDLRSDAERERDLHLALLAVDEIREMQQLHATEYRINQEQIRGLIAALKLLLEEMEKARDGKLRLEEIDSALLQAQTDLRIFKGTPPHSSEGGLSGIAPAKEGESGQ